MILGPDNLLKLVKTQKLVEGLSARELENPEGAGFDLRLDEIYKISGNAFLGQTEIKTPNIKIVAKYNKSKVVKFKFTILRNIVFDIKLDLQITKKNCYVNLEINS